MGKPLSIRVLGCGTSSGVPAPGLGWGRCDPDNIRNYRTRSSILIDCDGSKLLVDTTPDCRSQLLAWNINALDGIFYTHLHADHTHGIDDMRWINQAMKRPIPCWARADVHTALQKKFGYAFTDDESPCNEVFRPALLRRNVGKSFVFAGETIHVFDQSHGRSISQGLRIGPFAYSTDVVDLDKHAFATLQGIRVWIVDALSFNEHPTHAHVDKVLTWADRLGVGEVYLTHMGLGMDYENLCSVLPDHVRPSFDGLELRLMLD